MRVAALTMAYNEPVWAPVWARHYARQVGPDHCYLLDHGSDDGSITGLGIQVERLARSPLDEDARAALVSDRAAELLQRYDAVVHADIDELVLADPRRYRDLVAYAAAAGPPVVTAIGLDVQHLPAEEPPLDPARPRGDQRSWVRFSAAMCKPAFIRQPVRWSPGFHSCEAEIQASALFLFHLRYADLALGLQRLRRTREQAFASPETNPHQRVPDDAFATMVRSIAQLPRQTIPFDPAAAPMAHAMATMAAARSRGEPWLTQAGDHLWDIPRIFRAAF